MNYYGVRTDKIPLDCYPFYGRIISDIKKTSSGEFVVLFTKPGEGTVVLNTDDRDRQVGQFYDNWNDRAFTYFKPVNKFSLEMI